MQRQSGNVLFLILIAVALFAALSYAVTSSTRNGSTSISKDKVRANASQIIQFGAAMRSAIMRVKISSGCTDYTLDFTSAIFQTTSNVDLNLANSNAPATLICHIFDAKGGAVVPTIPVANSLAPTLTNTKSGHVRILVGQIKGIGTDAASGTESANDLLYNQPFLTRETCLAINDILKVTNPGGEPPIPVVSGSLASYNGTLASTYIEEYADPEIPSVGAYCRQNTTGTYYIFVQILSER